jgi:putative membrane-bound dehydrogenase-like protein
MKHTRYPTFVTPAALLLAITSAGPCPAQPAVSKPPAKTPAEAVAAMKLPDGFHVNVFAAEPDVVQPFAFDIDDRGRVWVNENLNYETRGSDTYNAGPLGRIIILEDTDGDGRFDKKKLFIDKIFFPTGLAVGYGGVWVGSPPNLLFIPDKDGDGTPDGPPQVVLDGWARNDRHETLNSFTFGPDGWMYGLHGVFTFSNVGPPGSDDAHRTKINAGVWRYHPIKKKFEVFAYGTSNPWGLDFDDRGQMFITACVIPHLWHMIQGGRFQRQAGSHFNPYTYDDIKTIADHRHKSAHGGARFYLADGFPEAYRQRLFMCNIHEHAMLTDIIEHKGSGFVGHHGDDFLIANDPQWLGFNLELGPDAAIYILDWNDADICGRKVEQQQTGRIFRVTYKGMGNRPTIDLGKLSNAELVAMQTNVNDWYVRHARRLLAERAEAGTLHKADYTALFNLLDGQTDEPRRLRALWALHVTHGLTPAMMLKLLDDDAEYVRAWTIQFLCEDGPPESAALDKFAAMAKADPSPVVRLYLASALQRLPLDDRWAIAQGLVSHAGDADDHNLPLMDWYGIEPLVPADKARALKLAAASQIPLLRQYIARRLTGDIKVGNSEGNLAEFNKTLQRVAPGFATDAVGEGGVAFVKDHFGRDAVRTHPVDRGTPCILRRDVNVPAGKTTHLVLSVSHDAKGDWQLVVRADGKALHDSIIGPNSAKDGWQDVTVDLTPYAGKTVKLELQNKPNNWAWEFAYWGKVAIESK